jgi:hypothetical protein
METLESVNKDCVLLQLLLLPQQPSDTDANLHRFADFALGIGRPMRKTDYDNDADTGSLHQSTGVLGPGGIRAHRGKFVLLCCFTGFAYCFLASIGVINLGGICFRMSVSCAVIIE